MRFAWFLSPMHDVLVSECASVSFCLLQKIGGLVRYMTLSHRRDFIEAALRMIGRRKLLGMVDYLGKRYTDVCDSLGEIS